MPAKIDKIIVIGKKYLPDGSAPKLENINAAIRIAEQDNNNFAVIFSIRLNFL